MQLALLAVVLAGPGSLSEGPAVSVVLGGDIMLNGVPGTTRPFDGIAPFVREADVAIANLEIPLTTARTATTRKTADMLKRRAQFVLKADPAHAAHLAEAGFDMVSLGNNHTMDYGPTGLFEMLAELDRHRVVYAGAGIDAAAAWREARYQTSGGATVSLVSMLAFRGSAAMDICWPAVGDRPGIAALKLGGHVAPTALPRIKAIVDAARQNADLVVVALHWGLEGQTVPTAYQVQLGRAFVDQGADVVVGHHPHVLQGAELYRGRPILYSTGNLVSPRPGTTAVFRLDFRNGELASASILPASISGGRVTPIRGPGAERERTRFAGLSQEMRRRFPSARSEAMTWSLAPAPEPVPSSRPR
ncbi:MAG: CapA family protein [Fimbriimonadaceae bacterium]